MPERHPRPHDGEGEPTPHLRGGTRTRLNDPGLPRRDPGGRAFTEGKATREQLRDLLDSGYPADEIADIIANSMHLSFSDHPVVQEILQRRTAAYKAYIADGLGETTEQVYSAEKARALIVHIERLAERYADRPLLAARLPKILAPAAPGEYVATVYGVRIMVELDKAPVIAEQRGNPGDHFTYKELIEHAVPTGTRPDRIARYLIPNTADDEPMRQHAEKLARRHVAEQLGEQHVLIHLTRGDLPDGQWPLPGGIGAGLVLVLGVTVRAIPGAIWQIVLRPGPGLPPAGSAKRKACGSRGRRSRTGWCSSDRPASPRTWRPASCRAWNTAMAAPPAGSRSTARAGSPKYGR
ncbi:hypothetical protein [Nonomuraea basaltis]|uniref:hypothetical protein n=1 Tax=Nonomuraea basaltis TaxID=2495887 RepID=UPI00110C610E|nr:hypothetical protein [Nonomuraea basaltis]TMR92585.1 hypothetical protein EJK15_44085 [Nonomuraea basaltis]